MKTVISIKTGEIWPVKTGQVISIKTGEIWPVKTGQVINIKTGEIWPIKTKDWQLALTLAMVSVLGH